MYSNWSSRILNSIKTGMNSLLQVITLARSGGPSKQCPQDLIVPSFLKLGLLPFLKLDSSNEVLVLRGFVKVRALQGYEGANLQVTMGVWVADEQKPLQRTSIATRIMVSNFEATEESAKCIFYFNDTRCGFMVEPPLPYRGD
jgi:hypothetical protein